MPSKSEPDLGINSWLEDELYQEYLHDRGAVDESWKHLFDRTGAAEKSQPGGNGASAPAPAQAKSVPPAPEPAASNAEIVPLRGAAARIAENMAASVTIPLATSQRTVPVKVMDENRRIIKLSRDQQRLRRTEWDPGSISQQADSPGYRSRCRGQGRLAQPDGAEH